MRYTHLLYLGALILHATTYAHIITIKSMWELLQYLPSQNVPTLVIFDIDNTLLHPTTDLGSDQWFSAMLEKNGATHDYHAALHATLPLCFHVHHHIDLMLTEPDLATCLQQVETRCDHTICLTARSPVLCEKTLKELNKNNLDFHIPEFDYVSLNLPHSSIYRRGVLFCGGNTKDVVLAEFLRAIHFAPQMIVCVDDKESNLRLVERITQQMNIPSILIRYAGCDDRVAAYDAAAAEKHLNAFLEKHPLLRNTLKKQGFIFDQ